MPKNKGISALVLSKMGWHSVEAQFTGECRSAAQRNGTECRAEENEENSPPGESPGQGVCFIWVYIVLLQIGVPVQKLNQAGSIHRCKDQIPEPREPVRQP